MARGERGVADGVSGFRVAVKNGHQWLAGIGSRAARAVAKATIHGRPTHVPLSTDRLDLPKEKAKTGFA
jgi:hypothetical protein